MYDADDSEDDAKDWTEDWRSGVEARSAQGCRSRLAPPATKFHTV